MYLVGAALAVALPDAALEAFELALDEAAEATEATELALEAFELVYEEAALERTELEAEEAAELAAEETAGADEPAELAAEAAELEAELAAEEAADTTELARPVEVALPEDADEAGVATTGTGVEAADEAAE